MLGCGQVSFIVRDSCYNFNMSFSYFWFALFAALGIAVLFGGHYLIWRSLANIFNISGLLKSALAAFFIILPAAFFASAFLAHFSRGQFSRWAYVISASWLGIAVNLLLAAVLIWLVAWLMNLAGLNFNRQIFAVGIFAIALIASACGFWNAFHPQINNLEVTIKNLPTAWQGKTVVQLSDIHLGRVYGVDFLQGVVEQANAQNPDLILITGDLFDGMDGGLNVFIEPLNNLQAKEGIFFVTGNHEAYVGIEEALAVLRQTKIRVLMNEAVNLNGLQIVGLDYALIGDAAGITGKSTEEGKIISVLSGFEKNKPSILMYHAPVNIEQAAASGISWQLAGHTHRGQIWPFNFFTWLIYGRYDYGLNTLGDFTIYTTNGIGTWGPPMRTGNIPEIPVFKLR